MRWILVCALSLPLAACGDSGCRNFDGGTVSFCVPSRQVLGSVAGLPRVSEGEIGFFLGKDMSDAERIVVTLTTHEYLCETNPHASVCLRDDLVELPHRDSNAEPQKRFLYPDLTSMWNYVLVEDEHDHVIARCSEASTRPGFGRCTTSGVFGDVHYTALFYDDAYPNPQMVREQVARWLEVWRKPEA